VEIKSILRNASYREKALLIGALALLIMFLIYQLVYVPLMRTRDALSREKLELESRFGSNELLAERYLAGRSSYEQYRVRLERKKSLSVLTYLENEAQRAGVRERIEYIRPRGSETRDGIVTSTVEMKIDAIAIRDLLLFLGNVELQRDGLMVSYLRLKPFFKERDKVDVVVRVTDVTVE
jgi:hypothetical protein